MNLRKKLRKRLNAGTVPANKEYAAGTVPANKEYTAGTVPANKEYAAGTLSNVLAGHISGCWCSALGAGMPYNRLVLFALFTAPRNTNPTSILQLF